MRLPKTVLFLLAVVSAVALVTAVPTINSQDAGTKSKSATKQKRRELPVVDFPNSMNTPTSSQRRAKDQRYDIKAKGVDPTRFVIKESDPEELYELTPSHAPERVAIPAAQSDAVVIGEVVSSEAHLSNDRTDVYSEFGVRVEAVLKNTSEQGINSSSPLTVERRGGAVHFPSGKVLRRGHINEMMPLAGRRYVLFLRSDGDTESFSIITGYELRDGRVFPLDGMGTLEGSSKLPRFAAYEGVDEGALFNEVLTALAVPASSKTVKGGVEYDN